MDCDTPTVEAAVRMIAAPTVDEAYWSRPSDELRAALNSGESGLDSRYAGELLQVAGPNAVRPESRLSWIRILGRQLRSPLVILLMVAAGIAAVVGDRTEMLLIVLIVAASCGLGFAQEFRASRAVQALRRRLGITCQVWRDGVMRSIASEALVPGDIVELSAGSLVPADGVVLEALDCYVVQSVLTGESVPVEKLATPTPAVASLPERTNALFMGTSVRSGTARMLVVRTGAQTAYGRLAQRLEVRPPESDF